MPASSAASCGLQVGGAALVAAHVAAGMVGLEVRARGRLDPVGAVAEVDRVQVVAQDLLLGPLVREVVGERGLAELLEERAVVLGGERVLDELLGDRRAALDGLLCTTSWKKARADAAQVDAVVGVEAAVLDRDDRVLHHRRDLRLSEKDPLLVAGERAELVAVVVEDDRVAGGRELELRQVGGDRHHHPEHGRDRRQHAEADQQQEEPQLADPHAPAPRLAVLGLVCGRSATTVAPLPDPLAGPARDGACAFVIAHRLDRPAQEPPFEPRAGPSQARAGADQGPGGG